MCVFRGDLEDNRVPRSSVALPPKVVVAAGGSSGLLRLPQHAGDAAGHAANLVVLCQRQLMPSPVQLEELRQREGEQRQRVGTGRVRHQPVGQPS